MLLLFLLFAYGQANCTYPHPMILYCYDIDVFPALDRKTDIVYIDIENTKLSTLPLFTNEDWPQVEFMTFKNNTFLPCYEIQKQKQDHILYIDHDCIESEIETKSTNYKRSKRWIIISTCVCILSFVFFFFITVRKERIRQIKNDCAFQSV